MRFIESGTPESLEGDCLEFGMQPSVTPIRHRIPRVPPPSLHSSLNITQHIIEEAYFRSSLLILPGDSNIRLFDLTFLCKGVWLFIQGRNEGTRIQTNHQIRNPYDRYFLFSALPEHPHPSSYPRLRSGLSTSRNNNR